MLCELSSEELAWRAGQGCQACFSELVERHGTALQAFLHRRVHDVCDVEDLAQEAFVKAYENIADYRDTWCFSTWLYTIALRLAVSHHRKARPRPSFAAPQAAVPNPIDVLDGRERHENLWTLAKELPDSQYQALWLKYGRDLSVKEIAQTMRRSQVSVKVLLYRARTALARRWHETPPGTK